MEDQQVPNILEAHSSMEIVRNDESNERNDPKGECSPEKQTLTNIPQSITTTAVSQVQPIEPQTTLLLHETINKEEATENDDNLMKVEETDGNMMKDIENTEAIEVAVEKNDVTTTDVETMDESCNICYKWDNPLKLLYTATEEYQPSVLYENFTKGCQWSPDETCLLVPSEDFRIRIFDLPADLYSGKVCLDSPPKNFTSTVTVKEGGLIYDTCWYPFMNSWQPGTCCFLSTSRESPVHLWDAFTGELRATYSPYNQVDEVEHSISIQFINFAREIWAGFKSTLKTFDIERPGRHINTIQFKNDFPNVTGLVSCIRENPVMPGLVAFGTYSKCIGLYKDAPLCTFKAGSGVTQIEFSPCGMKLFSAVRRNNEFLCWDLRNPGAILYSIQGRQSNTNQRIQFDLTSNGNQIVSGGTDGSISVWDTSKGTDQEENLCTTYNIKLSQDCINGVNVHKRFPIIATSSGQRLNDDELERRDNSVRLWWAS